MQLKFYKTKLNDRHIVTNIENYLTTSATLVAEAVTDMPVAFSKRSDTIQIDPAQITVSADLYACDFIRAMFDDRVLSSTVMYLRITRVEFINGLWHVSYDTDLLYTYGHSAFFNDLIFDRIYAQNFIAGVKYKKPTTLQEVKQTIYNSVTASVVLTLSVYNIHDNKEVNRHNAVYRVLITDENGNPYTGIYAARAWQEVIIEKFANYQNVKGVLDGDLINTFTGDYQYYDIVDIKILPLDIFDNVYTGVLSATKVVIPSAGAPYPYFAVQEITAGAYPIGSGDISYYFMSRGDTIEYSSRGQNDRIKLYNDVIDVSERKRYAIIRELRVSCDNISLLYIVDGTEHDVTDLFTYQLPVTKEDALSLLQKKQNAALARKQSQNQIATQVVSTVAGIGASVLGAALAPVTGGASLAIAGVGIAASVTKMGINIDNIVENTKQATKINENSVAKSINSDANINACELNVVYNTVTANAAIIGYEAVDLAKSGTATYDLVKAFITEDNTAYVKLSNVSVTGVPQDVVNYLEQIFTYGVHYLA